MQSGAPIYHQGDVVVISGWRGKLAKHRVGNLADGRIGVLGQNLCDAVDSGVDRLVLALDEAVGEDNQRRTRRYDLRGLGRP